MYRISVYNKGHNSKAGVMALIIYRKLWLNQEFRLYACNTKGEAFDSRFLNHHLLTR